MRHIGIAVLLLALVPPAFAADEMPRISNLAELEALPAMHAAGGWDVRVACADPGADAGPWMLLYCDARHVGKEDPAKPAGHLSPRFPLGPLAVNVIWDDLRMAPDLTNTTWHAKDGLYCMSVPLTTAGVCHVEVNDVAGAAMAHRDFAVKEAPPLYWHRFAVLYDFGKGKAKDWSAAPNAIPLISGWQPVWAPDGAAANDALNALFKKGLPGTIPANEQWFTCKPAAPQAAPQQVGEPFTPLQLSLENEQFLIKAGGRQLTNWPDEMLVARWWLNGKPIPAPLARRGSPASMMEERQVGPTDHFDVLFGYPDSLGNVKEGDKIALQVLYCPCTFVITSARPFDPYAYTWRAPLRSGEPAMMAWSNNLEFTLTRELIAAREKMLDKP